MHRQIVTTSTRHSINILGISAFYHDSAACLVRDGEIIAVAQEGTSEEPSIGRRRGPHVYAALRSFRESISTRAMVS